MNSQAERYPRLEQQISIGRVILGTHRSGRGPEAARHNDGGFRQDLATRDVMSNDGAKTRPTAGHASGRRMFTSSNDD